MPEFDLTPHEDEYQKRVAAAIEQKVKGQEIATPPPAPRSGKVLDIMDALKRSLESMGPSETAA